MSDIKRIMIPTDFSRSAEGALKYAAHLLADNPDKEVTFVYVAEEDELARKLLASFKKQFQEISKAKCTCMCIDGKMSTALVKMQAESAFDLILMGTKGAIDGNEVTNTARLVLDVDAPVLVIPESSNSYNIKNIALALDSKSIDDSSALNALHAIARSHDARIHVLTINNEDEPLKEDSSTEGVLDYYLETLDFHHSFPKNVDIEKGIEKYVQKHHIDMLAILPRTHSTKMPPSEGRLTKLLTMHSKIPLLALD
ncbi:MAG: universal stress protein [Bacteroidota bacterium]